MKKRSRQVVREIVELAIDEITIEEIKEVTGIEVTSAQLDRGQGKEAGINLAYNQWRDELQMRIPRSAAKPDHQVILKKEFIRLMKLNRSWAKFPKSNLAKAKERLDGENIVFFYHEHAGLIQVRAYSGKSSENFTTIGYAMIEDPAQSAEQPAFLHRIGAQRPAKVKLKDCNELFLSWVKFFLQGEAKGELRAVA